MRITTTNDFFMLINDSVDIVIAVLFINCFQNEKILL